MSSKTDAVPNTPFGPSQASSAHRAVMDDANALRTAMWMKKYLPSGSNLENPTREERRRALEKDGQSVAPTATRVSCICGAGVHLLEGLLDVPDGSESGYILTNWVKHVVTNHVDTLIPEYIQDDARDIALLFRSSNHDTHNSLADVEQIEAHVRKLNRAVYSEPNGVRLARAQFARSNSNHSLKKRPIGVKNRINYQVIEMTPEDEDKSIIRASLSRASKSTRPRPSRTVHRTVTLPSSRHSSSSTTKSREASIFSDVRDSPDPLDVIDQPLTEM
ncbi:hypothetical protein BKA62DRAFT_711084 [Auriculariales sp. MPI-PUGE-AT-0066]|nr:hypothetical protein BKA62DRAFT_711084 [Auriculariales sp. MPI-PUGE-AT-0066]